MSSGYNKIKRWKGNFFKAVIVLIIAALFVNVSSMITTAEEKKDIEDVEAFTDATYSKKANWVKNGDTIYVNVTTNRTWAGWDYVFLKITSTSDAAGIDLNCSFNTTHKCFRANFLVSTSSSSALGSESIKTANGDKIYIRNATKSSLYQTLTVDNTIPETTATAIGGKQVLFSDKFHTTDPADINLSVSDTGSGLYKIMYRLNGGTWQMYTTDIDLTGKTSSNYIEYYAMDKAGNTEQVKILKVVIMQTWTPSYTVANGITVTLLNESAIYNNLIIEGTLNVINSTLFAAGGTHTILVKDGGTLNIRDYDMNKDTTSDASILTKDTTSYILKVEKGGKLFIENSFVLSAGTSTSNDERGLYLLSDDIEIYNTTFNDTHSGIVFEGGGGIIKGCTFKSNRITDDTGYGILAFDNGEYPETELNIQNNMFIHNSSWGVYVENRGLSPFEKKGTLYTGGGVDTNLARNLSITLDLTETVTPVLKFMELSNVNGADTKARVYITDDNNQTYDTLYNSAGSGEWEWASLDLSSYKTKVTLIFNYTNKASPADMGWYLDNIELIDLNDISTFIDAFEYSDSTPEGGDEILPFHNWFTYDMAAGYASQWEHGSPGQGATSAANGSYCWGIGMNDPSYDPQMSSLQLKNSFTCYGTDLTFWHWYDTAAGDVGGNVQVSVDGGYTWEVLPSGSYSGAVTDLGANGYSGSSGGWVKETINMADYIGQNIKLRFTYGDNSVSVDDGWYIDDIQLNYAGQFTPLADLDGETPIGSKWLVKGWNATFEPAYRISGNTFTNCPGALTFEDTGYGVIESNVINLEGAASTGKTAIDLDGSVATVSDNRITGPNDLALFGISSNMADNPTANSWIIGNTIKDLNATGAVPIYAFRGNDLIAHNIINNGDDGIILDELSGGAIEENEIRATGGTGIRLNACIGTELNNNEVKESGENGIFLSYLTSAEMDGNNVTNAGMGGGLNTDNGIKIITRQLVKINGGTISNSKSNGLDMSTGTNVQLGYVASVENGKNGIYVNGPSFVSIENCNLSLNEEHGIHLTDVNNSYDPDKYKIADTEVYGNGLNGIYLEDCIISIDECTVTYNNGNGVHIEGGEDIEIETKNKFDYNFGSGLYAESTLDLYVKDTGTTSTINNNAEQGVYLIDSTAHIENYHISSNAENGVMVELGAGGPVNSIDDPLVTLKFTKLEYNVDHGLTSKYTGALQGSQIFIGIDNNRMSYNGLWDLYTADHTWVDWNVDSTSTANSKNSNRKFNGDITVQTGKVLTLSNMNIVFTGEDNTITSKTTARLNIDRCSISTTSESFRFKVFSRFSLTNSSIEKADSIYVSNSPSAHFYGNVISQGSNGIYVTDSIVDIYNCEIKDNEFKGVFATDCAPVIVGTEIINNKIGFYALDSNNEQIKMKECTIEDNDFGFELVGAGLELVNSTVANNKLLDFTLDSYQSQFGMVTAINSQFETDKIDVSGSSSWLSRNWYLDCYVSNEALEPIKNATVTMQNEGGFDIDFSTGSDGWKRSIVRKEFTMFSNRVEISSQKQTTVTASLAGQEVDSVNVVMNKSRMVSLMINKKPVIAGSLPDVTLFEDQASYGHLNLNDYFTDEEDLVFSYISLGNIEIDIAKNGLIDIIPSKDWNGMENITFTATDSANASVVQQMTVYVIALNDPPEMSDVMLTPEAPSSKQELKVQYNVTDQDGGVSGDITVLIYWYRNGVKQEDYNHLTSITNTVKGETWYCELIASDGTHQSQFYTTNSVTIRNSKPSVGTAEVAPEIAYTNTQLKVTPDILYDVDDVTITTIYQWQKLVEGVWTDIEGETGSILDSSAHIKGDEVRVVVTPYDGTDHGDPIVSNVVSIRNTAPSIKGITIDPEEPNVDTGLIYAYPYGEEDIDGDTITFQYKWFQEGWPVPLSQKNSLSTEISLDPEKNIRVEVYPHDGEEAGAVLNVSFKLGEKDTDGDGIPDSIDDDIDGDGFTNDWESKVYTDPNDADSVPTGEYSYDTDLDGIPDGLDLDDDNDTVEDQLDDFPKDPAASKDTDGDGMPDDWNVGKDKDDSTTGLVRDEDDDNDGFSDEREKAEGTSRTDPDDFPRDKKEDTVMENTVTNILLIFIVVMLIIIIGIGFLYAYRNFIAPPPEKESSSDDELDKKGLLNYLRDGLGTVAMGAPASGSSPTSSSVAGLDLDEDLVECSNCNSLVSADSDTCPDCGAIFDDEDEDEDDELDFGSSFELDDEDEDLMVGEPAEEEEDEMDFWDEEDEKPKKKSKKTKKKSKKKSKKSKK